jgi:adenylate cyclase
MDFTVLGDHVNLAARLCSAAKPRQTLVSAAVVELAATERLDPPVTVERLEPIAVKGKSAPIDIYEVTRAAPAANEPLVEPAIPLRSGAG